MEMNNGSVFKVYGEFVGICSYASAHSVIFTFASSSSSSSFHFIVLCIQHSHVCNVYVAHKYSPITLCMRRYLLLLPLKLLFIIDNLSFILLSKTFKVRGVRLNACVSEA